MEPYKIVALIRLIVGAPSVISDVLRSRSKKGDVGIKIRMQEREDARQLKRAQVSLGANAAYAKGMKYWKGGLFTKRDKEKAIKQIRIAAKGGHLEAQTMAKMHSIEY